VDRGTRVDLEQRPFRCLLGNTWSRAAAENQDFCGNNEVLPDIFCSCPIQLRTGVLYTVQLDADLALTESLGSSFAANLYVDPVFTIDPTFLQQNPGYSLEFSDGIGNSPDAPEPGTCAMMLAGFSGLAVSRIAGRSNRFTRST
jgi:hypothetical protein